MKRTKHVQAAPEDAFDEVSVRIKTRKRRAKEEAAQAPEEAAPACPSPELIVAAKEQPNQFSFQEGDTGTGVFQIHEQGLSEIQALKTAQMGGASFAPGPAEMKLLGPGASKAVTAAIQGDVRLLRKLIEEDEERKTLAPVAIHTDIRLVRKGDDHWEGGEWLTPGTQYSTNALCFIEDGLDCNAPFRGVVKGDLAWVELGKQMPIPVPSEGALDRYWVWKEFTWVAKEQGSEREDGALIYHYQVGFDGHAYDLRFIKDRSEHWAASLAPGEEEGAAVAKAAQDGVAKSVPILKINEEKRLVTGIVLQPETVDAQGDIYDEEAIERAAHSYLSRYNTKTRLGYQHKEFKKPLALVESWVTPEILSIGGRLLKKGSWVVTSKVIDDEIWAKVKRGEVTGYSIGGFALSKPVG